MQKKGRKKAYKCIYKDTFYVVYVRVKQRKRYRKIDIEGGGKQRDKEAGREIEKERERQTDRCEKLIIPIDNYINRYKERHTYKGHWQTEIKKRARERKSKRRREAGCSISAAGKLQ